MSLPDLSPTQRRLYDVLRQKAGDVVSYAELDMVISVKNGTANLRAFVGKLRRLGIRIHNVSGVGYRLKLRKAPVPVFDLDSTTHCYAQDIQDAIHGAMRKHADMVGFESQVAIIGIAIGAILHQLPKLDREHYVRVLVKNLKDAPMLSQVMRMQ